MKNIVYLVISVLFTINASASGNSVVESNSDPDEHRFVVDPAYSNNLVIGYKLRGGYSYLGNSVSLTVDSLDQIRRLHEKEKKSKNFYLFLDAFGGLVKLDNDGTTHTASTAISDAIMALGVLHLKNFGTPLKVHVHGICWSYCASFVPFLSWTIKESYPKPVVLQVNPSASFGFHGTVNTATGDVLDPDASLLTDYVGDVSWTWLQKHKSMYEGGTSITSFTASQLVDEQSGVVKSSELWSPQAAEKYTKCADKLYRLKLKVEEGKIDSKNLNSMCVHREFY